MIRSQAITIQPAGPADAGRVREFLLAHNGALRVVSRGVLYQADQLPALLALEGDSLAGLLTYHVRDGACEVVTLHAAQPGRGVGTRLLESARREAAALGCRRLWLITTNDNEQAIRFYERRGMRLVAVHRGAIRESRKIKPEIPLLGTNGTPIEDEVEFEYSL